VKCTTKCNIYHFVTNILDLDNYIDVEYYRNEIIERCKRKRR
jgi:hypothetical protein